MEKKETLTNEVIRKKFVSQFELVNYAIKLAENMIRSGRESNARVSGDNVALHVIGEITEGKDKFVDLTERTAEPESFSTKSHTTNGNIVDDEPVVKKMSERKRRASTIVK